MNPLDDPPTNATHDRRAPLSGILVLDLTRVLSGPHCGRMLSDLGADVIKVEPPAGDLTRFSAPRRNGVASYFAQQNTGKRNLSIDLSHPDGVAIMLDLVERADVLLENYRPGVMARLGLGGEVLLARNPRIVVASISGYGQDGPWVKRRAYAPVVEAEAGLIASQSNARFPDGDATAHGGLAKDRHSHADVYAGIEACAAINAALFQRERTGRGQTIDVSMAETMLYVNEHLHDALWDGEVDPNWIRSFRPGDYPVLTVANGESLIGSGHPAERGTFDLFLAAMSRTDLADDPRFSTVAARLAHLDELKAILVEYALGVPDPDTFEATFAAHGLAVGRVREPGELAATDWAEQRRAIVDVDDRSGGTIRIPNAPWRFSDGPDVGVTGTPRFRGEDNAEVLRDVLGYDDERIADLAEAKVVSSRIPT
ncbi:MAG: CoA transferase [Ilumatobacter sp.]